MKIANVSMDLYSIVICGILAVHLFQKNRYKNRLNRLFIYMCLFNILMAAGDIPNWTCEGLGKLWYPAALRGGMFVFYASSAPLLLSFVAYLAAHFGEKVRVNKGFVILAGVLALLQVAALILGQFVDWFYYFTEDNIYVRGEFFLFTQLMSALIYLEGVFMIFWYRKCQTRSEIFCLSLYILLPMVAELFQIAFYGIALMNTAITVTLVLVFVNIQSKRELLMKQQEKELAESRIDIMLSQIQPHFLYNVLTTIRRLCDANPAQAKQAILDFSLFLRANMDSLKSKTPIPFDQELSHAEHYLALEKQRFGDRLQVVCDISTMDFSIPPLTLQPLVENAVRHGILKREEGGTIRICAWEEKDEYLVLVEDDGVGIEGKAESGGTHIGIENVRRRLEGLCGGTLELESCPGQGTRALIRIPKGGRNYEISGLR